MVEDLNYSIKVRVDVLLFGTSSYPLRSLFVQALILNGEKRRDNDCCLVQNGWILARHK